MFYAMAFLPSAHLKVCVRSLRIGGYKTETSAKNALIKGGFLGYVKKLGQTKPVFTNVNETSSHC